MTEFRRRAALGVVCMSALVVSLDNLILNVALPRLVEDLHASDSELQLIVASYLLVFAGLLLAGGSLGDRYGRARVLRLGLVIFGVSSVFAAFSASATPLVVCRGVMGIGAALIIPASVGIVANVYTEPRERGRALGVWSGCAGVGLALGPVVGGLLLSQFWWGSVFLVNVPIVVVVLLVGWWAIPDSRNPESSRFDPLGVVLSVLGISALVWATVEAPAHGWGSVETLATSAVAVMALGGFVLWELRCDHPMLEVGFFRNPRFSAANAVCAVSQIAWAGVLFVMTQLLQSVFGYSPLAAGVRLIPLSLAYMVAGVFSPRLAEYLGTKRAVTLGLALFAVGAGVLAMVSEHAGYGPVLVAMLIIGVGYGYINAPTTIAVIGSVPREKAGLASGTLSTTRQAGSAFGVAVVGSLLVSGYRSSLASSTRGLDLSGSTLATARNSLGSALGVARDLGGTTGRTLHDAARGAFIHGMHLGMMAAVAALGIGVLLALRYLPAQAHEAHAPHEPLERLSMDVID